jgi:hypothetical protein
MMIVCATAQPLLCALTAGRDEPGRVGNLHGSDSVVVGASVGLNMTQYN